jgi:hypothetical protein
MCSFLFTFETHMFLCRTLGNNLQHSLNVLLGERFAIKDKFVKLISRLLASIPPIIGVFIIQDLHVILEISGIFAVYVAIINPSFLLYFSRKKYADSKLENPFISSFGSNPVLILMNICGLLAVIVVFYNLFS